MAEQQPRDSAQVGAEAISRWPDEYADITTHDQADRLITAVEGYMQDRLSENFDAIYEQTGPLGSIMITPARLIGRFMMKRNLRRGTLGLVTKLNQRNQAAIASGQEDKLVSPEFIWELASSDSYADAVLADTNARIALSESV